MASEATLLAGVDARSRARTSVVLLALLSAAHFSVDLYSAALGAMQPLLASKLGLSLTQAGILGGVLIFSSSVMQPVYGYLCDRFHTRIFTVLAPGVAGFFISALGLAPGFPTLVAMVALAGVGIAAFHPQASTTASQIAGARRGRWMAIFISAGMLGLAVGPAYFSIVIGRLGLEGAAWAALPGLLMSVLLYLRLRADSLARPASPRGFDLRSLAPIWKPMTRLYTLVFIRSMVQVTFSQFLPLYLTRERGMAVADASYALSIYLASGAFGGFVGGNLADRIGGRRVILLSMMGSVPFLFVFFAGTGLPAMIGLALGGLMLLFTNPVNIVMAQELAPGQSGTVSALMMGFAWGMAGFIFIPLTGWASEFFGMHSVLMTLAAMPLVGFLIALKLPKEKA